MVLGLGILWIDTAGSSETLVAHWSMGCTRELADGASKEWPALGLWRLVGSELIAWTGKRVWGMELPFGFTSSFKVEDWP